MRRRAIGFFLLFLCVLVFIFQILKAVPCKVTLIFILDASNVPPKNMVVEGYQKKEMAFRIIFRNIKYNRVRHNLKLAKARYILRINLESQQGSYTIERPINITQDGVYKVFVERTKDN